MQSNSVILESIIYNTQQVGLPICLWIGARVIDNEEYDKIASPAENETREIKFYSDISVKFNNII